MKNFIVIFMIAISLVGIWFGNCLVIYQFVNSFNVSILSYIFLTLLCFLEIIILFFLVDLVVNGIRYIFFYIKRRKVCLITFFPFVCTKKDDEWNIAINMHFSFNLMISLEEYSLIKYEKCSLNIFIVSFVLCILTYFLLYYVNVFSPLVLIGMVGLKISLQINYLIHKSYTQRLVLKNLGSKEYGVLTKLISNQIRTNIQNQTLIGENLWLISYFDLLNNRCLLSNDNCLYQGILNYCRENNDIIILQILLEILFNEVYISNRNSDIKRCDEIRLKLIEIEQEQNYMYVGFVKRNYQSILKRNYSNVYIRRMYNSFI